MGSGARHRDRLVARGQRDVDGRSRRRLSLRKGQVGRLAPDTERHALVAERRRDHFGPLDETVHRDGDVEGYFPASPGSRRSPSS